MKIVLVRHGRAEERKKGKGHDDGARRLTPDGKKRVRQIARAIKRLDISPAKLLTSPLVRARETADIFAEVFGLAAARVEETRTLLPNAPPAAFLDLLRHRREACVFAFGHAPHLDRVLARIAGAREPFTALKKAGVVVIDLKSPARGRGMIDCILTPGTIKRLGGK